MLFHILNILVLSLTCSAAKSGVSSFEDVLIVGGNPITIDKVPWIVNYRNRCAGGILSEYWIITAALCTFNNKSGPEYVTVGSMNRNGIVHNVTKSYINPNFSLGVYDYDIKLLKLLTPIQLDKRSQPLTFGSESDIKVGAQVLVAGWGMTKENGLLSQKLNAVTVPVVDQGKCAATYQKFGYTITDRMFCAGVPDGSKDACTGDSGSPGIINNKLVGLVSVGMSCGRQGIPGVYARAVHPDVKQWINQITKLNIH